ncbi:MAG: nitrate reductase [Alcanivoracaceae bacterium]|nr:nitrate reductase [Alcanivoracaceae bacterium]
MNTPVSTTCAYCGVGCGVTMAKGPHGWEASGELAHPANAGRLCVKGAALGETVATGERLLKPSVEGVDADWNTAIEAVAERFSRVIREHGPNAVAFYVSGQLLTEDYYVANKLMKGFIGSANIDTNSRLCMSTAVAAHKAVLGSDTVAGTYEDLELADLLVITGSNMAWTHPVVFQRISAARQKRPGMKVVVIDPRRTATCDIADLHLAISPGMDGFLFDGLFAWLAENRFVDEEYISAHSENYPIARDDALVRFTTVADLANQCGLDANSLETFFRLFASNHRTTTVFSQGINQSSSGVDKATAILQCHLATGRIGKPGATPFSITGQPNAMGGREVGGLANQLAAHMDIANPAHHQLVSEFWQTESLATAAGLKATDLFNAVSDGQIKAIWIMATNPVVSLPDADKVRAALKLCPTVVVSDCVADTDTLALADIKLPAAAWGEKDGSVTNSERCISRQRAFLPLPGEARPDWWIISEVARAMGFGRAFDYRSAADVFREHARLSGYCNAGTRDFDISALAELSDDQYDTMVPVQWPYSTSSAGGTVRLYADGHFFTPSGKARFQSTSPRMPLSQASEAFPFLMNTGRIRDQWHTMTRTARASRLLTHVDEPFVAIHPEDLLSLGLREGQLAKLSNDLGNVVMPVRPDTGVQRGTVFTPIHWNDQFASSARVGSLTPANTDPVSGQPEYKQVAVAISQVPMRWRACLVAADKGVEPPSSDWWCRIPGDHATEWRLAGNTLVTLDALRGHLSAYADDWQTLEDKNGHHHRLVGYRDGKVTIWFAIAPEAVHADATWLGRVMAGLETAAPIALSYGRPLADTDMSALVCSCHRVRQDTLCKAIASGAGDVEKIGAQTRAGTNCGSCIPEIRSLLREHKDQEGGASA